eukprot:CAMPEP_0183747224 /NCGR_PEP_ID=MMETSP0737-20130205/67155_1 /TAXON_ID=385413 /ORGANISM="Thalassiosira miniscula, Strain CCMP1093" /LENGTH=49 /DNA_ID=CAMNT_0025982933 /DNA_START=234 /DNA_END=383 /DNA_ORIENTATION=+
MTDESAFVGWDLPSQSSSSSSDDDDELIEPPFARIALSRGQRPIDLAEQ